MDRGSGNRRYTVIAGKAKWKFRFRGDIKWLPLKLFRLVRYVKVHA
jgi:hypothetical protein